MHQEQAIARFDTTLQARLHKPWATTRDRVIGSLYSATEGIDPTDWNEEQAYADKTAQKLCECGRHSAVFTKAESSAVVVSYARCKSRMCPRCNSVRSSQAAASIQAKIETIDSPRMLTLTIASSDEPLRDQLKELQDSYRRLRRSKAWKKKIKGGVAVIEVTFNRKTGQWHPHLHVVVDGSYWKQADISAAWAVASNGSSIVDIRMIHRRSEAARYVAKYVAKIGDAEHLPSERIPELAHALHGLRLIQTCGTLHGISRETPESQDEGPLDYVAPLGPVAEAARSGDHRAERILKAIYKASRLRRTPDTGQLHPADQRRSRQALKRLRHWWDSKTDDKAHGNTTRSHNPKRKPRSRDGTIRLWQEPEHPASALTAGM